MKVEGVWVLGVFLEAAMLLVRCSIVLAVGKKLLTLHLVVDRYLFIMFM